MLFSSTIFAILAATLAAGQAHTSAAEAGFTIQPACPLQTQPSDRYTYNSSNPFPITTNATVHGSATATTTQKSGSTSTTSGGPEAFTGAASRHNSEVMGAMGGLGLFAAAVALL